MMLNMFLLAAVFVLGGTAYYFYKTKFKKLSTSLEQISDISFDLKGAAEQVGTVSRDLKDASDEQLDTLTATISASHEINSMIKRTNDNAHDLNDQSKSLQGMTEQGSSVVSEMVASSLAIKEDSENFKREMQMSIEELANTLMVIKEIAEKTKVINEIVFQTKLLSFNASVEAARAGEHGKGFAVVAEEVGKLASMSGGAANEISAIVDRSVNAVNTALEKTKNQVDRLTLQTAKKE